MNQRVLFIASCVALVTSAFTFIIRGDIIPQIEQSYSLSHTQGGLILGAAFWGMFASMLVGAPLCDMLGMKRILFVAFACHMVGVFGTIFAPHNDWAFGILFASTFMAGCGNGFVEIAINPLAATLYPTQKTHYLNILHAWWPGGLVLGGLLASFVGPGIELGRNANGEIWKIAGLNLGFDGFENWQVRMALILIPGIAYFLMCLPQKFPETERVQSGISTGEMFAEALRPMFIIWCICMLMTASTELGPQQWNESIMKRTAAVSGTIVVVYTSMLMFVLRHFAGPLAHRLSPVGMLTISAVLSAIGLRLMAGATTGATAFAYATIFGLGIAYFWPTMLGVTAERFPKGGALLLGIMGSVGNLAIALILPVMGYTFDRYTVANVPADYAEKQVVHSEEAGWALKLFGIRDVEKIDGKRAAELGPEVEETVKRAEAVGGAEAFRMVSYLPIALVVIFGLIVAYDAARGGYKAEQLMGREEQAELYAGGVQAPVE